MPVALAILAAYLVGSIDFALIVSRMHGVNIREVGSGNPGASNVARTIGKGAAALVLVGDMLKGTIAAAMGWFASGVADPRVHWAFAAGLAAVIGHCYPVFHRFKGGRGVATAGGVVLFTMPLVALGALAFWLVNLKITKTPSLGSMLIVAAAIPLALWQGVRGLGLVWLGLTAVLVVWRHRANIKRLLTHSEGKVSL